MKQCSVIITEGKWEPRDSQEQQKQLPTVIKEIRSFPKYDVSET